MLDGNRRFLGVPLTWEIVWKLIGGVIVVWTIIGDVKALSVKVDANTSAINQRLERIEHWIDRRSNNGTSQ